MTRKKPNKQHDAEFTIWLAGFIDGEGSLSLHKKAPSITTKNKNASYVLSLTITNTKVEALDEISQYYNGTIIPVAKRPGSNQADCFRFIAYCDNAIAIIKDVLPYLRVKKRQAEILLDYKCKTLHRSYGRGGLPQNIIDIRQGLVASIRHLNRRGSNADKLQIQNV